MVTVTTDDSSGKTRTKYPGITDAARRLRVSRQHLFYVLEGTRISPTLIKRYQALMAAKVGQNPIAKKRRKS